MDLFKNYFSVFKYPGLFWSNSLNAFKKNKEKTPLINRRGFNN
jgi:hypothetical protein